MTYQALTTAISGLRAAQAQLSVISNNVTNATTPGYNRQILPQSTQVLRESGQTVGVLTESAVRVVDMNLQRDLWTQVSASSMQSVQLNYLQQVQNFNGPPDKEFSVAAKIAELRDSFSALSDIPDDTQALEATVGQAQVVADKFNDYAELITTLRNDTQGDLQSSVNNVNNLLREINGINTQIRGAENFGNSVAGLEDQRDLAIKYALTYLYFLYLLYKHVKDMNWSAMSRNSLNSTQTLSPLNNITLILRADYYWLAPRITTAQ